MKVQPTTQPAPLRNPDSTVSDRRASWLTRALGRMHIVTVLALLDLVAIAAAVAALMLLRLLGLFEISGDMLQAGAIVTVLVASPIIFYALTIIREVGESRRTLRKMTERLAWAFHNAERANEAKSHFLANMSHELRTPLNAIIGFSDIIRHQRFGKVGNPRYEDYAKDINESGIHLLGIINDILDLAKIEAGHATMEDEGEFDVGPVLESAERMICPLAERQGVMLSLMPCNLTVRVTGVERMFRQIFINVISNAVKFTERDGSVVIAAEYRSNGNFVISISDTGIGMSPDQVKVALTPFGQSDNSQTRQHAGTGLGLPLAKAMMDMHGGRLLVKSEAGEGTTVVLIFPASRVTTVPAEALIA